jgi:protein SCO1/2
MIRALLILMALVLGAPSADAGLSRSDLAAVSVALSPSAHVDLDLTSHDATGRALTMREVFDGRPALVTFVDFTCTSLCGSDLHLLSAALEGGRIPPDQYRLVAIGIDPKDTPAAAGTMARNEIPQAILAHTALLLPDAPTVRRLTASLGFHYAYDATLDQFAHPAAIYVIAANGAVTAVLSPFALDISALTAALKAREPVPMIFDRIRILCYALDPATGVYTLRIVTLLKVGAAATVVLLGLGLVVLIRRARP